MSNLIFQTSLKEIPVTIDDKPFVIRELTGWGQKKWQESLGGKVSVDGNGKLIVADVNIVSPELILLPLCLFEGNDKPVPVSVLQTWPATVLSSLYKTAQELSGLNEKGQKAIDLESKNSSTAAS